MSVSRGQVAGSMRKTIENLREANAGLLKRCDEGTLELLAENERHAATSAEGQAWQDRCLAMQTERDEARVKADVAIKEHDRMAAMLRAAEAEVERLQASEAEYRRLTDAAHDDMRAEVARLRDIISPGDAAAYEQGMAALREENSRLRAALEGMVVKLVEGLSCGTGPAAADAMPLSEREREIVKGILKLARAALAPARPEPFSDAACGPRYGQPKEGKR